MRCCITPQLVGDQPTGLASLIFQQPTEETFSRAPITTQLDEDVDHITVLVNAAPEIVLLTPNVHEEFIQVPGIAQPTLATLERTSVLGTELQTPQSDALVGDDDPPLCQEIFDISEAQAEAVVEPNGMADDLRREPVSAVAGCVAIHPASLPDTPST